MVKLPLMIILEVAIKALNFRGFYHFLCLSTDIVIAGDVDHFYAIWLHENVRETLKVLFVEKIVSETSFVDKVTEINYDLRSDV